MYCDDQTLSNPEQLTIDKYSIVSSTSHHNFVAISTLCSQNRRAPRDSWVHPNRGEQRGDTLPGRTLQQNSEGPKTGSQLSQKPTQWVQGGRSAYYGRPTSRERARTMARSLLSFFKYSLCRPIFCPCSKGRWLVRLHREEWIPPGVFWLRRSSWLNNVLVHERGPLPLVGQFPLEVRMFKKCRK